MTGGYMVVGMQPRRRRLQLIHPLKQWRELMGKSQLEVAQACGLTQAFISYIEAGLRIPLNDALVRLRDYTGLPVEAFVLPEEFLRKEPNFLRKYRRPRRPPEPPPAS
jgi:transcriptional regulator with XRE-family HTH domain